MANIYLTYKEALSNFYPDWWITWPLSMMVRLGSIFDITSGVLRTAGTLADKDIPFQISSGKTSKDITYDSNGSAVVRFKPAGCSVEGFKSLAAADVGALVEFRKDSSILVVYRDVVQKGIRDVRELAEELVHRYWQGRWAEELVVVTELIFVGPSTVLVAARRGALIELRLNASVGGGTMTIADISTNTSVGREEQMGFRLNMDKATPFFRVVKLRKSWLGTIKKDYGPRQHGMAALPIPTPERLLEEARDSPFAVLETTPGAEQLPFFEKTT